MSQDPNSWLPPEDQKTLKRMNFWGRIFNGVAGLTMVLYLLAALLIVVPLCICCGMFVWDVATK